MVVFYNVVLDTFSVGLYVMQAEAEKRVQELQEYAETVGLELKIKKVETEELENERRPSESN